MHSDSIHVNFINNLAGHNRRGMRTPHIADKNDSELGLQDRDIENNYHLMDKEEEEENVYHVLENPGNDDYEDPDRERGAEMVDGVTEYEVPIQLQRNK